MEIFDAIIRSGQAGNPLAKRLSKEGRRVVLREGKRVQKGTPAELLHNPVNDFVKTSFQAIIYNFRLG